MTLRITIDMDNAAFDEQNCGHEVARILKEIGGRAKECTRKDFESCGITSSVRDINGNTVGKMEVTD